MIEFNDDLSERLTDAQAIVQRIKTRLSHTLNDIPYYSRGLDDLEFTYGSKVAAIKLALRDLGPVVNYDEKNNRIQIYDITVDAKTLLEE